MRKVVMELNKMTSPEAAKNKIILFLKDPCTASATRRKARKMSRYMTFDCQHVQEF
jgi:hypothetical protein